MCRPEFNRKWRSILGSSLTGQRKRRPHGPRLPRHIDHSWPHDHSNVNDTMRADLVADFLNCLEVQSNDSRKETNRGLLHLFTHAFEDFDRAGHVHSVSGYPGYHLPCTWPAQKVGRDASGRDDLIASNAQSQLSKGTLPVTPQALLRPLEAQSRNLYPCQITDLI